MKRLLFAVITAALLVAAGADAASPAPPTDAAMQRLMDKTGMDAQLGQIVPLLQHGLFDTVEGSGILDDRAMERLRTASATAYAPDLLRAEVKAQLRSRLTAADVQAVLGWLESPVGMRLRAMEAKAEQEEALAMSPDFLQTQQAAYDDLPAARKATLKRLAKVTLAAESAADTITSIMIGNLTTLAYSAPPGTFNLKQVKERLADEHGKFIEQMTPVVLGSFGSMYGAATDADLAAYLVFAESPVGRKFSAAGRAATDKAMLAAAMRFAHELTTDPAHTTRLPSLLHVAAEGLRARSFG